VTEWLQLLVSGITLGAIFSLVALGFVTIYRTSKVVNMAQGSFVMLGTLFAYSVLNEWGWPFWLAAIVSIVGVIVVGVLMFQVVLKPMLKAPPAAMILLTIAISLLIENLALLKWGGYGLAIPPFTGETSLWLGEVAIPPQTLWVVGITAAVLLALYLLNNKTLIGKQMTATATRPAAASLCGISTTLMIILAFAISAGIGAIGGVSMGSMIPIAFTTGGLIGLNGFVAAILGGWGSSTGAVVGGFTLGILESLFTGIVPAGYKDALAFVLLIVVVYFRPAGLLGTPSVEGEEG
jgi:branched-chain amino acid transport system permease protein